jgi:hypothetical protein
VRLVSTLVAVLATVAVAEASVRGPLVLSTSGERLAPRLLSLSGDGSVEARVTWTTYGRHLAKGRGQVLLDNCNPDCANGTYRGYGARFSLFAVRRDRFTRMTIAATGRGRGLNGRYEPCALLDAWVAVDGTYVRGGGPCRPET